MCIYIYQNNTLVQISYHNAPIVLASHYITYVLAETIGRLDNQIQVKDDLEYTHSRKISYELKNQV